MCRASQERVLPGWCDEGVPRGVDTQRLAGEESAKQSIGGGALRVEDAKDEGVVVRYRPIDYRISELIMSLSAMLCFRPVLFFFCALPPCTSKLLGVFVH